MQNIFCMLRMNSRNKYTCLHILTLRGFFKIFLPQPLVWCFQLILIIQYAVLKNIFACLFSVHNTIRLSRHEQVRLIRLRFERYSPIIYWKCLQICYKRRLKKLSWSWQRNRTPSAKRLSQTLFFRFWLRASLVIESFLLKLKTITSCFEHVFHNNLKDNVYRQVYSYKYCRLPPK